MRMRGKIVESGGVTWRGVLVLCVASFCVGLLFTNRTWSGPEFNDDVRTECDPQPRSSDGKTEIVGEASRTHDVIQRLDKTIALLESELSAARSQKMTRGESRQATAVLETAGAAQGPP